MPAPSATGSTGRWSTMQRGALLFIATWSVHTADHARRGIDATTESVVWAGTFVGLLAAVAITLVLVGHPTAPAIATVVFPSIAVGVAATHLLPDWGALSDPILVDSTTDAWSIVAVAGEIVAAAILGFAAWRVTARHGFAWRVPSDEWTSVSATANSDAASPASSS